MTNAEPHRLTRFQKLVTRGFQRFWRMSRGHLLRAEILVWGLDGRILADLDGTLPGTPVTRGQSAEDAIRTVLQANPGLSTLEPRLVAMALSGCARSAALTTHIALFEAELAPSEEGPGPYLLANIEALDGSLSPDLLTIIGRRRTTRGAGRAPVA